MKLCSLFAVLLSLQVVAQEAKPAVTGAPLPPWTRGMLDIHQLSTGRGNAAFFIFPDGTTMLVDAGAAGDGTKIADTDPRPNATRTAGAWIVRYIERASIGSPRGPHDVFVTTLREPTKASIGSRVDQLKAQHGHIVVRVSPGGDQYHVIVLDDMTEDANVVAVFGPYQSK
jgi:hypothetical protein